MESSAVHGDKAIPSPVLVASWSPKHEMLAVAFSNKPLSLYRLNWERLWTVSLDTIPHTSKVTALCWAPKGNVIAAGIADGTVILLNVEDASVVRKFKLNENERGAEEGESNPERVVALGFVQGLESGKQKLESGFTSQGMDWISSLLDGRLQKLFEPLASKVPTKPLTVDEVYARFDKKHVSHRRMWPEDPKMLSVLVGSSKRGNITISAFGLVEIAKLDTSYFTHRGSTVETFKVAITRDLCRLIVIQLVKRRRNADTGHLIAYVFDCSVIGVHSQEIRQLTQRMSKVSALLQAAGDTLKKADQDWSQSFSSFRSKMRLLSSGLSHEDTVDTLIVFLVSGSLSESMESFFKENLTEHGLKRLADELDQSIQLLNELMLEFQNAVEQCLFIIGELIGLSRTYELLESGLGISIRRKTERLQTEMMWLFLKGEKFRNRVSKVGPGYRLFFSFLLSAIHQANDAQSFAEGALHPHAIKIKEFLRTEFLNDSISPDLKMDESWPDENEEIIDQAFGRSRHPNAALRSRLAAIVSDWKLVFDDLRINLNKSDGLLRQVNLTTGGCRYVERAKVVSLGLPQVPAENFHEGFRIAFSFDNCGKDAIVVVQASPLADNSKELTFSGAMVQIPAKYSLTDIGCRKDDGIVLLLQDRKEFKGKLVVIAYKNLTFSPATGERGIAEELQKHMVGLQNVKGLQEIAHQHPGVRTPLAVSLDNVASVFTAHRVVHYDLEVLEDMDPLNGSQFPEHPYQN
ncbi:hypothetical protein BSKO_08786 [Bryopsis sp. KO-2023]|nr:hypothetical protein BSKO_08786 [Bryopsis sp. KO-2023]